MKLKKRLLKNRAAALSRGERVVVLHPTKGFRSRNIDRVVLGMIPSAPVLALKPKFHRVKLKGTKNEFYEQRIPTNKYAGIRRTP